MCVFVFCKPNSWCPPRPIHKRQDYIICTVAYLPACLPSCNVSRILFIEQTNESFAHTTIACPCSTDSLGVNGVFGGKVLPGDFHTYVFRVPESMFDNTTEPCMNFMYTSGYDPQRDRNTGLVGPLLLCRKGWSKEVKVNSI